MQGNASAIQQQPKQRHQPREPNTYYVTHDFEGAATVTTTLAHAMADITGVDVTDSEFCLHDHVDPDALDRIFRPKSDGSPRTNGHLNLSIWGHQITVYSTGQIAITVPAQQGQR